MWNYFFLIFYNYDAASDIETQFSPLSHSQVIVCIKIHILNFYNFIPSFTSTVLMSVFFTQDERWCFEIPARFSPLCLLPSLKMKGQYSLYFVKACLTPICLEFKATGVWFATSFSYQLVLQKFRGWLALLPDLICLRALHTTGQGSIKSCILKPGQTDLCTEGEKAHEKLELTTIIKY